MLKKDIDQKFLVRLIQAQHNQCFYCKKELTGYMAIDHMLPVSKGGDNDFYNLLYACKSCNSKKRNITFTDYAIRNNSLNWLDESDALLGEVLCNLS